MQVIVYLFCVREVMKMMMMVTWEMDKRTDKTNKKSRYQMVHIIKYVDEEKEELWI